MRIISKFKDYYDGVQYYGQDQELIYVRNKEYTEENINLEKYLNTSGQYFISLDKPDIIHYPEKNIEQEHYCNLILGFCGELYRIHIIRVLDKRIWMDTKESFAICYNQEELNSFQEQTEYSKKKKYSQWKPRYVNLREQDWFNINNKEELQELFFKYNVPCFLISDSHKHKGNIILNPILSKYQFYKVKDAYTAFQDIAMFIGGVLPRTGHEMIEVSNNDLIVKRGFDTKTSFRKQKEK
jgi:hypothetical protein